GPGRLRDKKKMPEPSEQPEECQSCNFPTKDLTRYDVFPLSSRGKAGVKHKWLCELCASTMAGTACEYPEFYPDVNLYGTVCFIGNTILKAIRDAGLKPDEK